MRHPRQARDRAGLHAGASGKLAFGAVALATAAFILTGADHAAETWAVAHSPEWLTDVTTRF